MTCEFPCAPGRDNNVQCECLFLNDGDYSASRSNQIAVVIAGLDPAIHLFRKKMDARVKILCRRSGRGGTSAVPNHH